MSVTATSARDETATFEMSTWNHRHEEMMGMIGTLEQEMESVDLIDIELKTDAAFFACGCGRGGINNFCNWA